MAHPHRGSMASEQMGYPMVMGANGAPLEPLKFGRCLHPGLEKLDIEVQVREGKQAQKRGGSEGQSSRKHPDTFRGM